MSPDIYIVIIIGAILAVLLVGFIVTILFLYQRRQHRQEFAEIIRYAEEEYERETLKSQLEIQEETFKNIGQELHDNIGQMLSVVKLSWLYYQWKMNMRRYEPIQGTRQVLNKAMSRPG